mmetsp:Transcript_58928/g.117084  ORF Transcript_58928/g.117084 Transcript_58928/m.117084 type:complete len:139 (-) Transcript_58928:781-1197(-)
MNPKQVRDESQIQGIMTNPDEALELMANELRDCADDVLDEQELEAEARAKDDLNDCEQAGGDASTSAVVTTVAAAVQDDEMLEALQEMAAELENAAERQNAEPPFQEPPSEPMQQDHLPLEYRRCCGERRSGSARRTR